MISIIIAMYNMEKYIEECLDSVFTQEYKDIEVIVVDDGSTDKSVAIVETYQTRFANLHLFKQLNSGQAAARNFALKHTKGEYISYLDADDYLEPNSLGRMAKLIETRKADLIVTGYKRVFGDGMSGKDQVFEAPGDFTRDYTGQEVAEMLLKEQIQGFLVNKLFRKSLLDRIDFHQKEGKYIEDLYPTFEAIINSNRIAFLEGHTYNYRQRASSSSNERNERLLNDYYDAAKQVYQYARNEKGIQKSALEAFEAIAFLTLINYYTQIHLEEGKLIYEGFATNNFEFVKPSFLKVLVNPGLSRKRKISLFLWDLRMYHLVMKIWMKKKYN